MPRRRSLIAFVLGGLIVLGLAAWFIANDRFRAHRAGTSAGRGQEVYKDYAGSKSCRECHQKEFEAWAGSHHGLAERPMRRDLDGPAFDPARQVLHGTQTSRVETVADRFQIETMGSSGRSEAFVPLRVIGVSPLRQFLIPSEGGRLQATELAWDPHKSEWFDMFGDQDRRAGEWGHWTGRGMTWNTMCAACHNTRLLKNYDEETDSYRTTMAEMGVGCESCHGPLKEHVDWQKRFERDINRPAQGADPTLPRFSRDQIFDTCGSCHARRAELTGDFKPGDLFAEHYSLVIPDDTDLYYADGQVRDENYEYASFLSSPMHGAGVRCIDCHEPHSAKIVTRGNALCMRCHEGQVPQAPVIRPFEHSFHAVDKPGGQCVDCHMPLTVYMERHPRRDHGFTSPDPLLTKEFGIPNACNRCHADQTVEWAIEYAEKWYGAKLERPSRERTRAIARARAGGREAVPALLDALKSETNALWRASAAALVGPWAYEPLVLKALGEATLDPDPLVRANAVRSFDLAEASEAAAVRPRIEPLLSDPARAVRVAAAWALRRRLDSSSAAGVELDLYLRTNADQPTGSLQVGVWHLDRGNIELALKYFRRAVHWDPNSAGLRQAFAVALSMAGDSHEAVRQLEAGCRAEPNSAECHYRLGLALNEVQRLPDAIDKLEKAVALDAGYAAAWYNLGLAYAADGRAEQGLGALNRAETLQPEVARHSYAQATILFEMRRIDEARAAAMRTVAADPNHGEALNLLRLLR